MPLRPEDLQTGGALQGAVAASLLQQRHLASELAAGSQVGPYRVVRELGRGGMAIVYLAERADGEYLQDVALKWMQSAHADAASEVLFRRERQALADLRHPHIARLIDGGRAEDGRPWFAMEYIDGAPIDRHCIDDALAVPERLHLFLQVCAAVAFAHARGVIHRDIKPSNVLVDSDGSAKLLDFGIAQLVGDDDEAGLRAFTPGFASPEQLRGETPTVASDVYQLGRLLAALLAADRDENETLLRAEATRVTRLEETSESASPTPPIPLPARVPRDLSAILQRAAALDPARRYPTAAALADDVRAYLEQRPVAAVPRTAAYLARRFVERHPRATTLAVATLLTVIAMAAAFTWRLRQERDLSRAQAARAEAVSEFLTGLFRETDPTRSIDASLTARELVQRGATRLLADESLPSQIQAELFATLADIEISLGETAHASDLMQRLDPSAIEPARHAELSGRLAARRGQAREAVAHFERALALQPTPRTELLLARAESDSGATAAARERLDRLLQRVSMLEPELQSSVFLGAGVLRWRNGQPAEAVQFYERGLAVRDITGHPMSEAAYRINAGLALIDLYRLDEALASFDLAERSLERAPNRSLSLLVLQNRGIAHFRRGDHAAARRDWSLLSERSADGVNPGQHASALHNLATTFEAEGDAASVIDWSLRAARARDALGDRPGALSSRINVSFKLAELDLLPEADALARRCIELSRELKRPDLEARALLGLAKAQRLRGSRETFDSIDTALALQAHGEHLLKRLEMHEARARGALRFDDAAQLARAVAEFRSDAGADPEARIAVRLRQLEAMQSSDPVRALLEFDAGDIATGAVWIAAELAVSRRNRAAMEAALARTTRASNADYWKLAAAVAQARGASAEHDRALAEIDALRSRGRELLAQDDAGAAPASPAPSP